MSIFQVIAVFFALFMIYVVRIHHKKARLSQIEVSFWHSLWIFFIFIALFPFLLTGIANQLSFARVFDLLVVLAFMVLSVVSILNYFKQREINTKLEEWVRNQALMSKDQHNEKK